jgi:alpha-ribazole phosphatase
MDVYLIRHSRLDIDSGICYGQSEVDLAPGFDNEFDELRTRLPQDFDRIYSSPLLRCTRLAERFASDIHTDHRLLEYHFGDWELQSWDEIDATARDAWMQDFVRQRPPGGETMLEMAQRVGDFIVNLRTQSHQRVLIVTHAGVIRCAWAHLLQVPLQQVFKLNVGYGVPLRIRLGEHADFDQLFTHQQT